MKVTTPDVPWREFLRPNTGLGRGLQDFRWHSGLDCGHRGGGLRLADIDSALEEGPILNADARRGDISSERAFRANVYAIGGRHVAVNLAHNHDFASADAYRHVGVDLTVDTDGDAVRSTPTWRYASALAKSWL